MVDRPFKIVPQWECPQLSHDWCVYPRCDCNKPRMSPVDPRECKMVAEKRGGIFFWSMIGLLIWLAFAITMCSAAAQFGQMPRANTTWPTEKAPNNDGDWLEFPPGVADIDINGNRVPAAEQEGAKPHKGFPMFDANGKPLPAAKWIDDLQRPDGRGSCCGPADAYAVTVIEEGDYNGEGKNKWVVDILDGTSIKYPDGTERPSLPQGLRFHVMPIHVNPPKDGNPFKTAVMYINVYDSRSFTIYCLIPLPPSW